MKVSKRPLTFDVRPRMAFLSNVGGLAEPLSKEQWESDAGERPPVWHVSMTCESLVKDTILHGYILYK